MSLTNESVLVTGAAGFIGSHVVDRLLGLGALVVGVDNFDPFYSPVEKRDNLAGAMRHPGFRLVEADCADPGGLASALGNGPIHAIVHLAAKASARLSLADPLGYLRANVLGTQVVLEVARRREIRRLVVGSSSSVYGNTGRMPLSENQPADHPLSPYAATKRANELQCAAYSHLHAMTIVALRLFTVYGPRQRPDLALRKFGTLMLRGAALPVFGDGSTARDYTWIDDIVDGVVAALERTREAPARFEIINLGGGRATRLDHLIALLARALDVEPRITQLPLQPADPVRTCADVSLAGRLLGYTSRTLIEDGIPRFAEWLRGSMRTPSALGMRSAIGD